MSKRSYAREIESHGEKLLHRQRNTRLGSGNIDLLVVTDKSVYIAEVKVKPRHSDVTALLAKG